MKEKILSIFVFMLLIAVIFPAAEPLDISNENNSVDNIIPVFNDNPAISNTNRAWSIVAVYPIPEGASGLTYDGTYLYCGIYGVNGDEIYQIDPSTGSYSLLFSGPQDDAFGLTYDGTYLWTTHHPGSSSTPAVALQLNMSGNLISQFNLPDHYMSGIAYDNGDFWVATYYPDPATIYKVNSTGSILKSFTAPDNQPWDLCLENDSYLWMADYWGDTLYKIDPESGNPLESHASEKSDPAGIVWDGEYLWYCDNGMGYDQDYLYKVDLQGSGTPEIYVPNTSHDFGAVVVGDTAAWNATVGNVGTADLMINNVTFTGIGSNDLSCPISFPIVIGPGNQSEIPIVYGPLDIGSLDAIATIESTDPISPEFDITLTGNGVASGPDIYLPEDTYNYGSIRKQASKRWIMEIQNVGDDVLTVSDIVTDRNFFYVDAQVTFPIDINVLESVEVGIWFQPGIGIGYSATLTITNNDPDENPYYVSLQGTGVDTDYPIGTTLWDYIITGSFDNKPKTIDSIPDDNTRILWEAIGGFDRYDYSPKAIGSIPDVNGDGWDDVIVCSEDGYVRCLNGGASGTADMLWESDIGSVYHQSDIAISEDVDDDGYSDVVVGMAWGVRAIFALSSRTGDTIWMHDTHEYGSGGWVYMVDCSYDYNGDGVIDVLASTGDDAYDTGPKRVYCLDAITGVSIWECPLGGPGFSVIGIEDFTGDGQPDVLAGASNEAETTGYAYGINGATGAISWTYTTPGSSVWALEQIDDVNGDGVKDVIIGDFYGNIYGLNATTGNQEYSHSLGSVLILRFENIDDVNDDGHSDILPAHSGTTARVINGYTGAFVWSHLLVDKSWCVAGTTDISGDGINDAFIGTLYSNNYCYFLNGTDGSELHSIDFGTPIDAIAAIPDIVGDGSMEMIAGGRNGDVFCFSGGTALTPSNPNTYVTDMQHKWNFISLPFNQSIDKTDIIINYGGDDYNWTEAIDPANGPLIDSFIFGWNRGSSGQTYQAVNILDPGYGYWIYAYSDCELWTKDISVIPDNYITDLGEKWNTIGIPFDQSTDKTNLTLHYNGTDYNWTEAIDPANGPLIDSFIFGWNRGPSGQTYQAVDVLEPGYSYWMYAYYPSKLKQ